MATSGYASASVKSRIKTLPVVETFHSVQGEGFWTGNSAFFIRLAGCDVGCPWCDTKHSWPMDRHPRRAVGELVEEAIAASPAMVVITGGEPLLHNLDDLTLALHRAGLRVHLETSGSHPLSGDFDWISLSPKRYKAPLEDVYSRVNELKVVVGDRLDIAWAESAEQKISPETVKLLQPLWNSKDGERIVFEYVLSHPDWRVGLQTHKFLGVR